MKRTRVTSFTLLVATLVFGHAAEAEVTFKCADTGSHKECAFHVMAPDERGNTNFVVEAGKTNTLSDLYVGGKYCVERGDANAAPKPDWPARWVKQGRKKAKANVVNE